MKPNKSDVSEGYTSDALLNGPDILFEHLALVIRSFLLHGTVTKCLLACAFLPLLKPRKDPVKTDSYRAIAGSSLILKLIDNVILLLWGDLLGSDSLQFGFKAKVSTTQCTWLVSEVSSHYLRSGTPVITTLLDCSKAFDKCQFVPLFKKLIDRGVPKIVVRMLIFIYTEQEAWVKWGSERSETFRISNGTRSVLSPAKWVNKKFVPKVMPGGNVLPLSVKTRMLLIPRRMDNLGNALSVRGLNTLPVLMPMPLSFRASRKG